MLLSLRERRRARATRYKTNELPKFLHSHLRVVGWIKAHVGHEGNEEADGLAKLGTTNGEKHIQVGTPQAEIKSDISRYVRNLWDEEWQTYSEGKHTKEFYTHNDKNKAKHYLFSHVSSYLDL